MEVSISCWTSSSLTKNPSKAMSTREGFVVCHLAASKENRRPPLLLAKTYSDKMGLNMEALQAQMDHESSYAKVLPNALSLAPRSGVYSFFDSPCITSRSRSHNVEKIWIIDLNSTTPARRIFDHFP